MKVKVPLMIQDPAIAGSDLGIERLIERWEGLNEDHYLAGPITPRVAVIDLDPDTGGAVAGAAFRPPAKPDDFGRYQADEADIFSAQFIQVSVFATVMRTMYMFEESDTLGRQVSWAFGAPQLLVVPRAGWWENAYYERRSHSLQFFSFRANDQVIHTALSRDIVAHETAHALIDGIDPDLYDALDPQALALHEGIADLVAMLIAFRSGVLREAVLTKTGGSIRDSTDFSSIAAQFGAAIHPDSGALRNLRNESALDPTADPGNEPEEHELSQVFTGALYEYVFELHEALKRRRVEEGKAKTEFAASGFALDRAGQRFKRMLLRALDYIPPGEITFADYFRAIIAADKASHPADRTRDGLIAEIVQRGIVKQRSDLDVETNISNAAVSEADLQGLVDSDWAAYTFADENRDLLGIPADAQFQVLPRLVVTKDYYPTRERVQVTELLFKVRWTVVEPNPPELGGAPMRRIQTGTTLVIDWDHKHIRALMRPLDLAGRRPARDATLRRLMGRGLVRVTAPAAPGTVRSMVGTGIEATVTDDVLRVRNTARLMHIAKGAQDD